MRSGTVESLNANGLRTITVELLTGETFLISAEGKTTCRAIWNRVEAELKARGVVHPQIFGLAIKTGTEWVFTDPDAKVYKYFSKEWKSSPVSGLFTENKPLILYCRIHFYLETLPQNLDEVSILHYYLQVRQNLVSFRRNSSKLIQAVAYAYQSELGDWTPCQDSPRWAHGVTLVSGVPSSTVIASLTRAHQALDGVERGAARQGFIRALTPTYNMHLYGMTLRTKEGKDAPAWIGVTPKGIEIYQTDGERNEIPEQPKITFLWANITKLYFERKKFEIRGRACCCGGSSTEKKLSFTGSSESVPKHLLLLCRTTHQFHLSNQKILLPNQSGDGKTTSSSTTAALSGIPSDTSCNSTLLGSKNEEKMLDLSLWADGLLLPNGNETTEHQRVSVISNASSNTTSGIVSDRVYSLDGSEEDLDLGASDCCTDRAHHNGTNNSASMESIQNIKYTRKMNHNHISKSHRREQQNGTRNFSSKSHDHSGVGPVLDGVEPKYWYCDSDCEDHCEDGTCKSLLVRTINTRGEKPSCSEHCECNSCLAEEDEFERLDLDSSCCSDSSNHVYHTNTPSMASEKTLKALDISGLPHDDASKSSDLKNRDNKPSLSTTGVVVEAEHIYGEISEDSKIDLQYLDIGNNGQKSLKEMDVPRPKPRCKSGTVMNNAKSTDKGEIRKDKNVINGKHLNNCGHKRYKLVSSANNITVASMKDNTIIVPKVASLKCLRTQKVAPWTMIKTLKESSNNKNKRVSNDSLTDHNDETDSSGCYADFDKLQQGKYPSSRTVSDNFDTDSDYVQLPPLLPRPLPPKKPNTKKLWKFVTNKTHHKSCGNVNSGLRNEENTSSHINTVNTRTLPRNRLAENICNPALSDSFSKLALSKPLSRSTTVLNTPSAEDRPPEPPPKPRKLAPSSEVLGASKPVDARFITTKPQILIQTAYATPANVAIPSKAQLLYRGARIPVQTRRTQSQIISSPMKMSHSMDNIYDTVASEDVLFSNNCMATKGLTPLPPPLLPKPNAKSSVVIRPNNYIDVHASSPARAYGSGHNPNTVTSRPPKMIPHYNAGQGPSPVVPMSRKNRCGSVPNNLHTFLVGLQNLKPLSRSPIVHPGATSCLALNNAGPHVKNHSVSTGPGNYYLENVPTKVTSSSHYQKGGNVASGHRTPARRSASSKPAFTTVYTNQLSRSQIQQFKAQLYSDMDYVIFPPKDPRLSQQEYFDSKSLSLTTMSSTNSNPMLSQAFSAGEIPPPYLPPPPPYSSQFSSSVPMASHGSTAQPPVTKIRKPPKPLPSLPVNSPATPNPPNYNSYQSLYNPAMSSNTSQCSSSQYGYYGMGNFNGSYASSQGLNVENLQKFLSTQSLAGSNNNPSSPPTIYYPASTHSAPPLPYNKNGNQVIIENGMRKAVQKLMSKNLIDDKGEDIVRMKLLSRSEESLYSQPFQEETLQTIYNLPPPPPYKKKTTISPSEVDLATLRVKCSTMELPMLKALCSDGALLTQTKPNKPSASRNQHLHNFGVDSACLDQPPARPPKPANLRQMK